MGLSAKMSLLMVALILSGFLSFAENFEFEHSEGIRSTARIKVKKGCLYVNPVKGRAEMKVSVYEDLDRKGYLKIGVLKGKVDVLCADIYRKLQPAFVAVASALGRGEHTVRLEDFGFTGRKNLAVVVSSTRKFVLDYIRFVGKPGEEVKPPESTLPPLSHYTCYRARSVITVDGSASEPDWKKAPSTGNFFIYHGQSRTNFRTEAKMLWDDKNLYILLQCEDRDINATKTLRDDNLWTEECVEVFILEQKYKTLFNHFLEYEVNPLGTLFDCYNIAPCKGIINWDSKGWKCAVKVDGTINDSSDNDKGWTVEMSIPFIDLHAQIWVNEQRARAEDRNFKRFAPRPGDAIALNLYRIERGDGYGEYIAWSPTVTPSFHRIDRFGVVTFSDSAPR